MEPSRQQRRGKTSNEWRQWTWSSSYAAASWTAHTAWSKRPGFSMCDTHEPTASYLALFGLVCLCAAVCYAIYKIMQCGRVVYSGSSTTPVQGKSISCHKVSYGHSKSSTAWQKKIEAAVQAGDRDDNRVSLPPIIYVSSKIVGSDRSYHTCEQCPALKRIAHSNLCSATVCKSCDKIHSSQHTD